MRGGIKDYENATPGALEAEKDPVNRLLLAGRLQNRNPRDETSEWWTATAQ